MQTNHHQSRHALRLTKVIERLGISKTHIYRLIAKGQFPAGHKISERISVWDSDIVDRWLDEKLSGSQK